MHESTTPLREPRGPRTSEGVGLLLISILGTGIGYVTSVVAARSLGEGGFEDYAVAVASLGLLSTLAEAGTGKYALRAIPGYVEEADWGRAAGYWRFSIRACLAISVLLMWVVILSERTVIADIGDYPLGLTVLFLPALALSGVMVDFVMANRAAVFGACIARLAIPATTLFLLIATAGRLSDYGASWAITCFGLGSVTGVILAWVAVRQSSPREVFTARPQYCWEWMSQCAFFGIHAFLATWMLRVGILAMELLPVPESEVAYLAAAMETACLVLLVSKSTDKMFQPDLALVITRRRDLRFAMKLRRRRLIAVGAACLAFFLGVVLFGERVLALYGPGFTAGYPALCLATIGSCVATLFSLAPVYLKFRGRNLFVLSVTCVAAVLLAALTVVLGMRFGATGAAAAFSLVMVGISMLFLAVATRDFFQLAND